jgi:hypothetical protein
MGTTGTRYLVAGNSDGGASTGLRRMRLPHAIRALRIEYTNGSAGTGAGDYTITLCTVASDVATTTTLTLNVLATARNGGASAVVNLAAGTEIAIQTVVNGTVTASPTNVVVSIGLAP